MTQKKQKWKGRVVNFIFFGVLLFLLVSTTAKSWLLRGLLATGIFSAKIEQKTAVAADAAMPLSFVDDAGNRFRTSDMKGNVLFINFWASWCPPCRAEMPSMNSMYQRLRAEKDFEFIFVNLDDDEEAAKRFLKENQYAIPLQRAEGFIPADLYSGTLPTTVVIDKQGAIVMKHSGMANYDSDKFIGQLRQLQ